MGNEWHLRFGKLGVGVWSNGGDSDQMRKIIAILVMCGSCFAQSGILVSSRYSSNWSTAGLPATFPDGETTTNPWTPPSRTTQYGSTINPSGVAATDLSNINTAMAACTNGDYVLLGSGTFLIQGTLILAGNQSSLGKECTLRGSGPMSTTLSVSGSGNIWMGSGSGTNNCLLTSGSSYTQGSMTIICNTLNGTAPAIGDIGTLTQCDTGFSGSTCATGSTSDNGGLYVCGDNSACQSDSDSQYNIHQQQTVEFTSVLNSSGTYTIGINNGLYNNNWAYAQTPILNWNSVNANAVGVGLEDLTVYAASSITANQVIQVSNTYASWIKGVRFLLNGANPSNGAVLMNDTVNNLFINNYCFPDVAIDAYYPTCVQIAGSTDDLILNNFTMSSGVPYIDFGLNVGNVYAYNFGRDVFTGYPFNTSYDHHAFDSFVLLEGNQLGEEIEDNTWGTHALDTYFRNLALCNDSPYTTYSDVDYRGFQLNSYQRFMNLIGNAFGSSYCSNYSTNSQTSGYIYQLANSDALTAASFMRWGNVSVVQQSSDTPANSGIRFVASEVPNSTEMPSGTYPNAVTWQNSTPANDNLPCSFYFTSIGSSPCSPKYSGGTGLSFWKVCKTWTTFPTSCSATQTQPFPIAGPELTSGTYVNGYAYDVPAAIAWENLPVDTTYQNSYSIASSSWTGGVETLTFSSAVLPNVEHLMGAFQLSGVNSACTIGAFMTGANSEILMTGSTATTVTYALTSNPGVSCTGTMKFPDVREFDEKVYEADPTGAVTNTAPCVNCILSLLDWTEMLR
jgi:hypothetical protein